MGVRKPCLRFRNVPLRKGWSMPPALQKSENLFLARTLRDSETYSNINE